MINTPPETPRTERDSSAEIPRPRIIQALSRIPRTVWALGAVSFLTDVSTEMATVVLPLFLTGTLGASVAFVGLIEGIAETTASLLKVFSGWLSDKLGRRKVLVVIGYSLSAATRPLFALAGSAGHILGARVLDRVGKGLRTSPRDALLADSVAENERGFVFGFHRAMDHAGAVVGPLIAFMLLAAGLASYRGIFWLAAIPALLTIPILIFGVREIQHAEAPREFPLQAAASSFSPQFRRYLVVVLLFTLGNSSDAFLLLRAKSLGIADAHIPLLFAALHVSKMLSSVPGGALSDRFNRKTLVVAGWLIYAAVYFGFAHAANALHVWALFICYGFFFGLTEGTERAWVADLVPRESRGRAYGLFHFAIGLGALPASLLMGWLWVKFGIATAFHAGAAIALVSALCLQFSLRTQTRLGNEGSYGTT